MNINTVMKKKLREILLKKRKALGQAEVIQYSEKIFKKFQNEFYEIFHQKIKIIAGYMAVNNEVDTLPILRLLQNKKIKTVLPKIVGSELKFYEWHEGQTLICNEFNIKEPVVEKEAYPDCLIVPLVGFDKYGNRLGYGFGYYDKALKKLPHTKKIGVGYSFQQVENIPCEVHDVKLDIIVTDKLVLQI